LSWGRSETCAIGTNNPVTNKEFSGSIGLPLPSIEVSIKDDGGKSLPPSEPGEICSKGPQVMTGYFGQPEETEKALNDGFRRTGDIGMMDEHGHAKIITARKI
jgi:long-subunit acyl-CoA synthetase (AMP-forming)